MDPNIFNILEFLASNGVGKNIDISGYLNGIRSEGSRLLDNVDTKSFLAALEPYTSFNEDTEYRFDISPPNYGFVGPKISITNDGITALKSERDRIRQAKVDQSAIDVNQSIIATNTAVQNMDKRMLEHAQTQEAIMLEQSGFSSKQVTLTERQVTLIGTQNKLYRITLILTLFNILIGIVILIITIKSGSENKQISTLQLKSIEQQKEIKRLQLLKSDTVHYVLNYPVLKKKKKEK